MTGKKSKLKSGSELDVLVIGAGVSGLITAAVQLKAGRTVHLTEKLPKMGGRFSPEARENFLFGSGFFPEAKAWRKR